MIAFIISSVIRKFPGRNANLYSLKYLHTASNIFASSSVNPEEVKKFTNAANDWWDENLLLHSMNSVRVPFIRDGLLSMSKKFKKSSKPLNGYSILDVGCGGGILSEPLARLGANVTGLDPGIENIEAAIQHVSSNNDIKGRLTYVCDTVENHVSLQSRYDAVVCSEVVEHVNSLDSFVSSCVELTKDGGSLFFTTINRTSLSYILSILFAEYVTGLVPKGTHNWNKFVQPKELSGILESLNCQIVSIEGVMYNPITQKFGWCSNNSNLYALHAIK